MILWDFILAKMTKLFIPDFSVLASAGRPTGRPGLKSVDRVGRPTCTDVHVSSGWRAGRPTRSTVQRVLLSGKAPVDRAVDRQRALLSVPGSRSTGRSTAGSTVRNLTVGRSTDWPSWLQQLVFLAL